MYYNEALVKLLRMKTDWVRVNGILLRFLPDGAFTPQEIEDLRDVEKWSLENDEPPSIANFLPDDVRPAWIKKM